MRDEDFSSKALKVAALSRLPRCLIQLLSDRTDQFMYGNGFHEKFVCTLVSVITIRNIFTESRTYNDRNIISNMLDMLN